MLLKNIVSVQKTVKYQMLNFDEDMPSAVYASGTERYVETQ